MIQPKPELLSPAGSFEALEAAVRSGADAVYLGAKRFSARRNAQNFDDSELKEAVAYCRVRGVKVYLTANIMIKESEIKDSVETVKYACRCGVDGVIVQDIGLAAAIREVIPGIELHASTQMTVHSPSSLGFLKDMGFGRVVAAREMSRDELSQLCRAARELDMEVEVFVHGALCMCVSGQCLLSAVLGGRSGNRGLCAGPCRLPFKVSGGTGHDLSLKDLSLIDHISELCNMGVSSFKIEGRMKRPEYIAAATAAYRFALDGVPVPCELKKSLSDIFSRSGFTDGYYLGNSDRGMFGVRTDESAELSKSAYSYLHGLYRNERSRVPVSVSAEITDKAPVCVTVTDGKNRVDVFSDPAQLAKNRPLTEDDVKTALGKLGGTPYYAQKISVNIGKDLFVPAGVLNSLRRSAEKELSRLRAQAPAVTVNQLRDKAFADLPQRGQKPPEIYVRFENTHNLPDDFEAVSTVIFPFEKPLPENLPDGVRLAVEIPRWTENESEILKRIEAFKNAGFTAALCGTVSSAVLAEKSGLSVIGGPGLNISNSKSCKAAAEKLGLSEITLSPELSVSEAKRVKSKVRTGIFAYGRLPLMLLRNCPLKNGRSCAECPKIGKITDRMGIDFPIICRGNFRELLNSAPLFIADRLSDFSFIDYLLLYFTDEGDKTISDVIKKYSAGGQPPENFTRGLYYRNTL